MIIIEEFDSEAVAATWTNGQQMNAKMDTHKNRDSKDWPIVEKCLFEPNT